MSHESRLMPPVHNTAVGRLLGLLLMVLVLAWSTSGCDSEPGKGDAAAGTMEAEVDGSLWEAESSNAVKVGPAGNEAINIVGTNSIAESVTIALLNIEAARQYDVAGDNVVLMSWTTGNDQVYRARSGSIEIDIMSNERVKGSFSFVGIHSLDSSTVSVSSGQLDLEFGVLLVSDVN